MKKNLINKFAPFQAYEGTEEVELVSIVLYLIMYLQNIRETHLVILNLMIS